MGKAQDRGVQDRNCGEPWRGRAAQRTTNRETAYLSASAIGLRYGHYTNPVDIQFGPLFRGGSTLDGYMGMFVSGFVREVKQGTYIQNDDSVVLHPTYLTELRMREIQTSFPREQNDHPRLLLPLVMVLTDNVRSRCKWITWSVPNGFWLSWGQFRWFRLSKSIISVRASRWLGRHGVWSDAQ